MMEESPPRSFNMIRQEHSRRKVSVWAELGRMSQRAWAGNMAVGVFLVVGFAACHETGPSVVAAVIFAGMSALISGNFLG